MHTSAFPQICNHSSSCRTSILEGATFHKMSWCKFHWANPSKAIETFYHWDFFSWDFGFSTPFSHSAAWKNSETLSTVSFFHAYWFRGGDCNCLLSVGLPLPTISKNSLYTMFCHWILDHGVSIISSIPGAKIIISYVLLDTSFHHRFQSVIIRSYCSSHESPSQHGLEFSDSRILHLYNPSKMSSDGIFVIDQKIPSHFESNFLNIIISKTISE